MQILRRVVLLLLLNQLFTQTSFATWVAVIQQKGNGIDHIHVTVAKDKDFEDAKILNIWNQVPHLSGDFGHELSNARKFVVFQVQKSFDLVLSEWTTIYTKLKPKRFLLSKNCAYATKLLMTDVIGIDVKNNFVFPHVWRAVYLPNGGSGTPLPDAVRIRIKKALKKAKIPFYTEQQLKRKSADVFLNELSLKEAKSAAS